jgi:hypothetical protein
MPVMAVDSPRPDDNNPVPQPEKFDPVLSVTPADEYVSQATPTSDVLSDHDDPGPVVTDVDSDRSPNGVGVTDRGATGQVADKGPELKRIERVQPRGPEQAEAGLGLPKDPESVSDRPSEGRALREVIDGFGEVTIALQGVLSSWNAGVAELTTAREAGRAPGISDHDFRRVASARPKLEQALGQITEMKDSADRGSEPSPAKTANLAVQLTDVSAAADLVRQELPRSSVWRSITKGFRAVFRGLGQLFTNLPNVEVTGISFKVSGGLPFGLAQAELTLNLSPRAPPDPGEATGGPVHES